MSNIELPSNFQEKYGSKYHGYRAIFPQAQMMEFVVDGEVNCEAIANLYGDFLDKHPDKLYKTWVDLELLWNSSGGKPIRLSLDDASRLRQATLDLERELPMPEFQHGIFCYEFPWALELMVWKTALTAMIVAPNSYGIGVVWQFEDGDVMSLPFSWELFMDEVNKAVTFPRSMHPDDATDEQAVGVLFRQRLILAYHLCNGLDALREYQGQGEEE